MTRRLRWYVEMETRCRIPIWRTFGQIQWHVIPQPRVTLQGAATWWIHCHDSRAACHTAGCSRLTKSMSWSCHIAGCKNSIRHIENRISPYFIILFLMQLRLWRAAAFVSSPIYLLKEIWSQSAWNQIDVGLVTGVPLRSLLDVKNLNKRSRSTTCQTLSDRSVADSRIVVKNGSTWSIRRRKAAQKRGIWRERMQQARLNVFLSRHGHAVSVCPERSPLPTISSRCIEYSSTDVVSN